MIISSVVKVKYHTRARGRYYTTLWENTSLTFGTAIVPLYLQPSKRRKRSKKVGGMEQKLVLALIRRLRLVCTAIVSTIHPPNIRRQDKPSLFFTQRVVLCFSFISSISHLLYLGVKYLSIFHFSSKLFLTEIHYTDASNDQQLDLN